MRMLLLLTVRCGLKNLLADANMIHVAPHNPNGLVSTLASMHIMASCYYAAILESSSQLRNPEQWQLDLHLGERMDFKDGYSNLPSKPGLGIDLGEKVAIAHHLKALGLRGTPGKLKDGSVPNP